jgi:hypothetical protein
VPHTFGSCYRLWRITLLRAARTKKAIRTCKGLWTRGGNAVHGSFMTDAHRKLTRTDRAAHAPDQIDEQIRRLDARIAEDMRAAEALAAKMREDHAARDAGSVPTLTDDQFVDEYERIVFSVCRAMTQSQKLRADRRARDRQAAAEGAREEAIGRRAQPHKRPTRH